MAKQTKELDVYRDWLGIQEPERPPNTTPTRSFRGVSAMGSVVSDPGFRGENSLGSIGHVLFCRSRHARHWARRAAMSFSAPRSVGR